MNGTAKFTVFLDNNYSQTICAVSKHRPFITDGNNISFNSAIA